MSELFGYSLSQFIMVSPEVFQDLHQRYWHALWPWLSILVLCNGLIFLKKYRHLIFVYTSLCWLLIAFVYFNHYFREVHTLAWVMAGLFVLQSVLLFVLKVLYLKPFADNKYFFNWLGLIIYCAAAFVPFSLLLENSKGTVLLFGWGVEQTAAGTIGLIVYCYNKKRDLLLAIIPLFWLGFYMFFL